MLSEDIFRETMLISFETGHAGAARGLEIDSCCERIQIEGGARQRFVSDFCPTVCSSEGALLVVQAGRQCVKPCWMFSPGLILGRHLSANLLTRVEPSDWWALLKALIA